MRFTRLTNQTHTVMEFKGTKGKWTISKGIDKKSNQPILDINAYDVALESIVTVWSGQDVEDDIIDEVKANAHLIAHAPEMLEMLSRVNDRLIRRTLPTESELNQFVKDIHDLLTRATTI